MQPTPKEADRRDPDRGRRLRAMHYRVSFYLAVLLLALDGALSYFDIDGREFDALRLGALASLILV